MGRPVVVPRTKGITDYFAEDELLFFEPDNLEDLVSKIEWAFQHPSALQLLVQKGRKIYEAHRWEKEEQALVSLVAGLFGPGKAGAPAALPRPRRIAMLAYSHYESDARVMRYAQALAHRGDKVEVLALKSSHQQARTEVVEGVKVSRIQCRPQKQQRSKAAYLFPLLWFHWKSSCTLGWRHLGHPYDAIHVHNVPDFLVFAAWLPKLGGAKVILDIHGLVPEFFASKFGAPADSRAVRLLKRMERWSAQFADHVIVSNHLWHDKYAARTGTVGKTSVFINNVDTKVFCPRPRHRADGKFILLSPGGLQRHQGLDVALRAFRTVRAALPQAEFHIYGDGNMKSDLVALTDRLGLDDSVQFFKPVPVTQIAGIMADADVGVVPKRADAFGNEAYSTKIMEFMSLGVPVVVSDTKVDRHYFSDSMVRFFEAGNPEALAEAVLDVNRDAALRRRLVLHALEYATDNNWESREAAYLNLVDSLVGGAK
jgi:glycosyltransferase involved in cell wall biosynthesis